MAHPRHVGLAKAVTLAVALVVGLPGAGLMDPSVANAADTAAPRPTATCSANNQNTKVTTTGTAPTKGYKYAVGNVYFSVAPHQSSGSRTIQSSTTYTGDVTATAGVETEAGVIIAKVKVTGMLALHAGVAFYSSDSAQVGPLSNTTGRYRETVAFYGTRKVAGNWATYKCGLSVGFWTWITVGKGTYAFWDQVVTGMLWCDDDAAVKTKWSSYSIQYNAVSSCS